MHDTMVQTIIRNGYDQCQLALRKLTSRRFYKQYVQQQQSNEIAYLGNQVDVRELQLDALGHAVEEILSQLRYYSSFLRQQCEDDNASIGRTSTSEEGSHHSSSSYSFHQQLLASQPILSPRPLPTTLDLHPHARRKRQQRNCHDRRRVQQIRQHNTQKRTNVQNFNRDQLSDEDLANRIEFPNTDAFSNDQTLSDCEKSQESATTTSSFYQQISSSQHPSQPSPSALQAHSRRQKKQRIRHQQNLEPRRRMDRKRSKKFLFAEKLHDDRRKRNDMDRVADLGTYSSGDSDLELKRNDAHLDGSDVSGVRGGTGKDKTAASLLRERSNSWQENDQVRRIDGRDKGIRQKRSVSTVSSGAMRLNVVPNDENQQRNVHKVGDAFISSNLYVVPEIETMLPSPSFSREELKRGERRHRSKKTAADLMEKWLESNAVQSDSNDSQDRTRNIRSCDMNVPSNQDQELIPAMFSPDTMRATQARLFSTIGTGGSTSIALAEAERPHISDLKRFCCNMNSLQSNDLLSKALNDICLLFESGKVGSCSDAHFAFKSMVDLLLKDDMIALQHLVSKESPNICRFVSVVVAILRLLRCKANEKLISADDDIVFRVFSNDRCEVYLNLVLFQLVDTLLSLFHPQAWNLCISNTQFVLEQLKPLRDELARHFDLLERACQSLSREIGPQEWRYVRDGDGIYVSSINPDDWRSLLTLGAVPPKSSTIRFAAFDDVYPRCEVDAIWCLVGFLAGSGTCNYSSDDSRWYFLSQLLFKGSLTISHDPDCLSPPNDQMEAAVNDLTNLTTLIASGALGDVPRRDTLMVDLIQRCVSLECDFVEANNCSGTAVNLSVQAEKLPLKLSMLFEQPSSNASTRENFTSATYLLFLQDLSAPEIESSWMNKPLLLPSSRLLRCCLALLLAWKNRISFDKVKRLQCLENVIKALVKSLTRANAATIDSSQHFSSANRDAFLDAFTTVPRDENFSECSRLLVRTEIAAYISLLAPFGFHSDREMLSPTQHFDVTATCELLWNIVSDDTMRQRRNQLSSRGNLCRPKQMYNGDVIRLCIASKVFSLLGILIAGKNPFRFDSIFSSRAVHSGCVAVTAARSAVSALKFVLSTLIACLDCISDSTYNPKAISSIALCTLVGLNALDHVSRIGISTSLVISNASPTRNPEDLKSALQFVADSQVLHRVLKTVLSAQNSGLETDICLQSILLAIRYVIKIYPQEVCDESVIPHGGAFSAAGTDEDFGEIDDAVLADIDLGHTSEGATGKVFDHSTEWIYSMCNALVDALLCSKPSSRNCIYPNLSSDSEIFVSMQAMKFVSNHADLICTILAEVAATRWHPSCPMKALWNVSRRFSFFDDQDDIVYMKALGMRISRQICRSYDSTIVRNIVQEGGESIFFNMLESMIDHKLLRRIPSCNLDRIRLNGGSSAEEQGFAELFEFKKGNPKRLRRKLDEMRSFCHDFSHALFTISEGSDPSSTISTFNRVLLNYSGVGHHFELVPSLEQELLHRFKLFQGLLIEASTQSSLVSSFERLSALLLASCSYELVLLLQRIGIQDQAYADVKQENYGRSKLFETVACMFELLVNLISETLRCQGLLNSTSSDDFIVMLRHIFDHFASPLLDGRPLKLLTVLREIVFYGSSFLNGTKPNIGRIANLMSPNFDLTRYCVLLRTIFLRRTRELVVAIAASSTSEPNWKSSKLLNTILVAGITNNTDVTTFIAQCLCRTEFYGTGLHPIHVLRSPMELAIDEQYAQMEKAMPLDDRQTGALYTVRLFALRDFAVSKLLYQESDTRSKILLLRFIQCILDHDSNERLQNSSGPDFDMPFDVLLLCSIARGIGMSVRNIVDSNIAEDTLVIALYTCSRSLMSLPASCVYPNSVGWLVDWAYPSPQLTSNTIHSNYIWYFCCWMREFGGLLLDTPAKSVLRTLRDASKTAKPAPLWLALGSSEPSVTISCHLNDLEHEIFAEPSATRNTTMVNRYKTTSTVRLVESNNADKGNKIGVPIDEWQPSKDVRYAVHQFIEKVKFATPTR
jgi:hypothetical protein